MEAPIDAALPLVINYNGEVVCLARTRRKARSKTVSTSVRLHPEGILIKKGVALLNFCSPEYGRTYTRKALKMKRFLPGHSSCWFLQVFWGVLRLYSNSPRRNEPIAQTQPSSPKAKTAWYDTHTANHIVTGIAVIVLGICCGYLIRTAMSNVCS